MTIHKEGHKIIAITAAIIGLFQLINFLFIYKNFPTIGWIVFIISLLFFAFIISFFRIPNRVLTIDENKIISPADGKVVVIEEVIADEFNLGKCIQISVFMSPANVHVNRLPINGKIIYNKYHPGKYLVAWHPKSSLLNERWSIVIENSKGNILCKQIAGAVAKRIVNYTKVGDNVNQTNEYGFIKFGSRVDVLIPLSAKVLVNLNQKVQGGVTCLAAW